MSAQPASSPDPAQARSDLKAAARRAVMVWSLILVAVLLAAVGLFLVTLWLAVGAGYGEASAWAVALALSVGVLLFVVPFVPAPVPDPVGVKLTDSDLHDVATWVHACTGVRHSAVLVVADPAVWLSIGGRLRLGIGLVACLREAELAALVQLAHRTGGTLTTVERVALRLVYGDLGRGATRLTTRVFQRLEPHLVDVDNATVTWVGATERACALEDPAMAAALSARAVVSEGWAMLVHSYLHPALSVGAWHDDPWSGLHTMLAAWVREGADVWPDRTEPSTGAAEVLPAVVRRESELALLILPPELPHDDEATDWEDRPHHVDERVLRRQVAVALEAARVATGRAVPATVEALATVLDGGWGPTIASMLGVASDEQPQVAAEGEPTHPGAVDPVSALLTQVLDEIVTLTLLDSSVATLQWRWAGGSVLVDSDGRIVDVSAERPGTDQAPGSGDLVRLGAWIRSRGADPSVPVWLDEGVTPAPEMPVLAFGAVRGMHLHRILLTTRAFRFCKHKVRGPLWEPAAAADVAMPPGSGDALREDLHEIVPCIPLDDVVRVEASPNVGGVGSWWLTVWTENRRRTLWTSEDRTEVLQTLAAALGDRLSLTWWSLPAPVRWARNTWGFLLSAGGVTAALVGVVWIFAVLPGQEGLVEGVSLTVGGSVAVVLSVVPDWLLRRARRSTRGLARLSSTPQDPFGRDPRPH